MARIMKLDPTKTYRAVLLTVYNHRADNWYTQNGLQLYRDTDDTVYQYHVASVYGPFDTRSAAKSAITREKLRTREDGTFYTDRVAEQYTFIEETSAVWTISS